MEEKIEKRPEYSTDEIQTHNGIYKSRGICIATTITDGS